jgi:hypothetical protein
VPVTLPSVRVAPASLTQVDPAEDPGVSADRLTTFRFEVLDKDERLVSTLATVQPGGRLSWSSQASVKGSGSLPVSDPGETVDWLNARIRPYVTITDLETGISREYAQGIWLCSAPVEEWDGENRAWNVELLDKNSILDSDIPTSGGRPVTYTLPKGTNVIAAVVALIQSTGESTAAIWPGVETLAAAMTWDMGTTLLKIINDLLDAANYLSLWCDEQGQFRVTKYVPPLSRPPIYSFESPYSWGEMSRLDPSWKLDRDLYNVPNRVVLVGQGSDEEPAWVATAIDNNPTSPTSYQNRGRWVTQVETEVEAVSAQALQESADRRLLLATSVTSGIEVSHPILPDLRVNGLVQFTHPAIEVSCVITDIEVALDPVALSTSKLQEVTT